MRDSITVKVPGIKPRNPLIAPALMRKAGFHKGDTISRQEGKRNLQREIRTLRGV